MSDVLFVCVRADVERAEALADMFEAAGFSIDGAPGDHEDVYDAGASIVFWSEASLRSREFLDTAQGCIEAGNAFIVYLSGRPPVSHIERARVFDLSDWDGDPDDPLIDPLFRAVDRSMTEQAFVEIDLPAQPVALIDDDDQAVVGEISVAETEYFALHGADAYAGLPVAWSAPEADSAAPPDLSDRPARRYRAPQVSLMRHGGAVARMMALALIVGSGVAFAATSFAPRPETAPVAQQEFVQASIPLDAVMEAGAPMPEFVPETTQFAQTALRSHAPEPASAPRGARFEPASYLEPEPLPLWLDAEAPAGAPLIAAVQTEAVLGSSELPDEMFKTEPVVKA